MLATTRSTWAVSWCPWGRRSCGWRLRVVAAHGSRPASSRAAPAPPSPGGRRTALPQQLDIAPVIVVGAGAAGLTAAYFAATAGAKVLVLERTREAGKKVLMSGGTRCNVLPLEVELDRDFTSSSSSSALRAAFSTWSLEQCLDWLTREVGLELQLEVDTSKWFPASNSGRQVRDQLLAACQSAGVSFRYGASLEGLAPLTDQQQQQPEGSPQQEMAGEADAVAALAADGALSDSSQPCSAPAAAASGPAQQLAGAPRGKSKQPRPGQAGAAKGRPPSPGWLLQLSDGSTLVGRHLVLATGGLSFPKVGTDGSGQRLLAGLGHTLVTPYAALTPLRGGHPAGHQLAGLTLPGVTLEAWPPEAAPGRRKGPLAVSQRGGFLFTHRGFSGPAVLDLSHWVVQPLEAGAATKSQQSPGKAQQPGPQQHQQQQVGAASSSSKAAAAPGVPRLRVNWVGRSPQFWEDLLTPGPPAAAAGGGGGVGSSAGGGGGAPRLPGSTRLATALQRGGLPERLAGALLEAAGVERDISLAQLKREQRVALVEAASGWSLGVTGHEGYGKAEVTGGGVPLEQVDCRSLESRVLPGVFLCGELLDVFGRIGGFNFYWAWLSGRAAGLGAAAAAAAAAEGPAGPPASHGTARKAGARS